MCPISGVHCKPLGPKIKEVELAPLVPNGYKRDKDVMVLGVALNDAREETFVILVCDGLPMGLAFKRAGFTSKDNSAPSKLFHLPRVQERAAAILKARRSTGVVTLPEVTSMLQRVFAGAHSEGEYSAAHNAAFSLARLYGHVTDRATLEVIRRPSRDPDAPSEQALEAWALGLPPVIDAEPQASSQGPPRGAPAALLGPDPEARARGPEPYMHVNRHSGEKPNDINELTMHDDVHTGPGEGPGRSGNGAPVGPVTGTPYGGGGPDLLGPEKEKGTGTKMGEKIPSFEELFGPRE